MAASYNARLLALEHLLDEDEIRSAHELVEEYSRAALALRPDSGAWPAQHAIFINRRAAFLLQYPEDPESDFATAKALLDEFASTPNKSANPFFAVTFPAWKVRMGKPEECRDDLNAILAEADLQPETRFAALAWLRASVRPNRGRREIANDVGRRGRTAERA